MVFFAELLPEQVAVLIFLFFLGRDVPGIELAGLRMQIGRLFALDKGLGQPGIEDVF